MKNVQGFLKENGFSDEEFNTNNAWGFGGAAGTRFVKGDIEVRVGKAYYRHLPPSSFAAVYVDGERVFDGSETRAVEKVKELLKTN